MISVVMFELISLDVIDCLYLVKEEKQKFKHFICSMDKKTVLPNIDGFLIRGR